MDALPPAFRKWSIHACIAECVAVILAFLFMVLILKWKIDATMMYLLLLVMVISAVLLLMSGGTTVER